MSQSLHGKVKSFKTGKNGIFSGTKPLFKYKIGTENFKAQHKLRTTTVNITINKDVIK